MRDIRVGGYYQRIFWLVLMSIVNQYHYQQFRNIPASLSLHHFFLNVLFIYIQKNTERRRDPV